MVIDDCIAIRNWWSQGYQPCHDEVSDRSALWLRKCSRSPIDLAAVFPAATLDGNHGENFHSFYRDKNHDESPLNKFLSRSPHDDDSDDVDDDLAAPLVSKVPVQIDPGTAAKTRRWTGFSPESVFCSTELVPCDINHEGTDHDDSRIRFCLVLFPPGSQDQHFPK